MKKPQALHIPGFGDICPIKDGMYVRLRTEKDRIKAVTLLYQDNKFDWWTEYKKKEMSISLSDSEWDYWSLALETEDKRFAYVFMMEDREGKSWWCHEEGVTDYYDHSLSFLNYFQYTSQFDGEWQDVPEWTKTAVCYQIFPERFNRGIRDKDESYITSKWGELPDPKSFFGGDLPGITEKLDHLEDIGVTLLYLTPVFRSISNHKYDIKDYENVDGSFGGNEALKTLIDQCHKRNIRVMVDGVFNHTSNEHPFFEDVKKKGRESKYADWYFMLNDDPPDEEKLNYKTFASVPVMPKLNTLEPEVIDYFSKIGVKWIREYGADAWRLDVSDEISKHFLRAFRDAVKGEKKDAIIIGEDWHRADGYLEGDMYDGVMNYGVMKAAMDLLVYKRLTPKDFRDRLISLYTRHSPMANMKMMNLLDSHDTDRFLWRVKGNHEKHRTALALQFFWPGFPSVYYGDETGITGGYDPDCRRCFDWNENNWDTETLALVRRLSSLKKGKALSEGRIAITEEKGIVTIKRFTEEESVSLRINATGRKKEEIPAWGFEIKEEK